MSITSLLENRKAYMVTLWSIFLITITDYSVNIIEKLSSEHGKAWVLFLSVWYDVALWLIIAMILFSMALAVAAFYVIWKSKGQGQKNRNWQHAKRAVFLMLVILVYLAIVWMDYPIP